jgi:hypothetical protein
LSFKESSRKPRARSWLDGATDSGVWPKPTLSKKGRTTKTVRMDPPVNETHTTLRFKCLLAPVPASMPEWQTKIRTARNSLSDLNLEECVIRVFMTPPEILPLLVALRSVEIAIIPMLLL